MKNGFNKIATFAIVSLLMIFISNNLLFAQEIPPHHPQGIILTPLNKLFLSTKEFTADYGLAIILMTLLLRVTLSPLQFISAKSSNKMKKIQPELTSIKEKWKNDSTKMREETLNLFKKESVNPFMAFVPVFLQMPLFFAFYSLLTKSPEIIGSHFIGWLTDLSLPDPFYVLPILAGLLQLGTMIYGVHDVNDSGGARKMKIIMPVVFTWVMIKLPVAVLIYTITSSVYSLIEKGVINRVIG